MEDPSPPAAPTQAQIDRINEISGLARTAWFSLIAYLLFVGITLLGVEDADFFVPTRQTQLPLVDVQIPTASFFYAAPILGAALYTYLHLFLIKLWEAHGQARTRDADPTHHWLVNDYALIRQGDPAARARPLSWLVPWITLLLVWLAGPIVLGYAWWRSMPAHDEWMTLLIAACFFTTLCVGFTSWTTARTRLRSNGAHRAALWHKLAAAACALALVAVSWLRTEGGLDHYVNAAIDAYEVRTGKRVFEEGTYANGDPKHPEMVREDWAAESLFALTGDFLAPTDLSGAALGGEPPDWREHDYARGRYRETWCERHEVPLATCEHIGTIGGSGAARTAWCKHAGIGDEACSTEFADLETSFEAEWDRERAAYLAHLDAPDQPGRDLRRADLRGAFLVDAELRGARLERAKLGEARLEGANLGGARLERADLRRARLERADLRRARLERAYLGGARLEGANLFWARLERANLNGARLEGANLLEARLEGANLGFARLEGANLGGARLEGANLSGARLEGANLGGVRLERADLRRARLEGANLAEARLEGAFLFEARLEGTNLRRTDLRRSYWHGASNRASPAQFADFRGARELTQTQLESLIGNAETLLPAGNAPDTGAPFYIWSCWEPPPPDLDQIIATAAGPFADDADRAALRAEFLCSPDNPRRKTGTPLALDAPYPEGHSLAGRE
jgi:uncharacterized protein YjbI with pentapeptide repeats